jgi:hypothetical protein
MHRKKPVHFAVFFLFLLLSMLLLPLPGIQAEEQCLKVVFNQYCLGGDIRQLQRQKPFYIHQQREGERFALVYGEGREKVYVLSYQNRIYKVVRQYQPATRLNYLDLKDLLTSKYGMPKDLSQYPERAKGLAAKIGAIRRGEGRALLTWKPPEQEWYLELGWNREMGLNLAYIIDRLDGKQRLTREDGY